MGRFVLAGEKLVVPTGFDPGWRRSTLNSPRATRTKVERSSCGMSRQFAISSAICAEGRRSPYSIFRIAEAEHPMRLANSSRVSLCRLRCCCSHSPNVSIVSFGARIVSLFGLLLYPLRRLQALFNGITDNNPEGSNK
jgi:hypothetical protein